MSAALSEPPLTLPEYLADEKLVPLRPADGRSGPVWLSDDWDEEDPQIVPSLLQVAGGYPLLYDGESHTIVGPGGSGKSWLCYHAVAEAVRNDLCARCVIVDYESNKRTVKSRLKALGVRKEEAGRIAYWRLTLDLSHPKLSTPWWEWLDKHRPSLLVLDSVGKSMSAAGLDENSNSDYHRWDNMVVVPLVQRRVTTMLIDHTGHAEALGGGSMKRARGASAKRDAVTGAAYLFDAVEPWDRTSNGRARLTVLKDREGHRKVGSIAADIVVTVKDEGEKVAFALLAPATDSTVGSPRKTFIMEELSKLLETAGRPLSGRSIEKAVPRKSGHVRDALATLLAEGFVRRTAGGLESIKPYRQEGDPKCDKFVGASKPLDDGLRF